MEGLVADLDGKTSIRETVTGSVEEPEVLGRKLARVLLGRGGQEILHTLRMGTEK
jgi:porphobilinogen deaminase